MIAAVKRCWAWLLRPWPFGIAVFYAAGISIRRVLPATACRDGWHSPSIGIRGACSHHGGVDGTWGGLAVLIALALAIAAGMWRAKVRDTADAARQAEQAAKWESTHQTDTPATDIPRCPVCHLAMRRRTAARGRHAGKPFWGCSRYPRCRGVLDISESSDPPREE